MEKFNNHLAAELENLGIQNPLKITNDWLNLIDQNPVEASKLLNLKVRSFWNGLFEKRTVEICHWVEPFLIGSVLDLICGDGNIGFELSKIKDLRVFYSDYRHRFIDSEAFLDYKVLQKSNLKIKVDTVILVTVLHHNVDPDQLMKLAFKIARKRVIIIENPLTATYGKEFHINYDKFFKSLNPSNDSNPFNHHNNQFWFKMASMYGDVIYQDSKNSISGVPFDHQLIVINKK